MTQRRNFMVGCLAFLAGPLAIFKSPGHPGKLAKVPLAIKLAGGTPAIGFYIRLPDKPFGPGRLDAMRTYRVVIEEYMPITVTMPCGHQIEVGRIEDLPPYDVPCPCGNPQHWLVKHEIFP
jgi:hypothetical protein